MDTILEVNNLSKQFYKNKKLFTAVNGISFTLQRGECLGIVGESGCGKSTTVKMLTHLLKPDGGDIFLNETDIQKLRGKSLKEFYTEIQMVFQVPQDSFDPRKKLGDSIMESMRNHGIGKKEAQNRLEQLLQQVELPTEIADRYPNQVSGGQCQRAAIARALAVKPSILICDEATSALDVTVQKQILELLIELKHNENLTVLFISHDLALVQAFCDHVMVLNGGKMVEYGTTEQVIDHPKTDYTRTLIESVL